MISQEQDVKFMILQAKKAVDEVAEDTSRDYDELQKVAERLQEVSESAKELGEEMKRKRPNMERLKFLTQKLTSNQKKYSRAQEAWLAYSAA